MLMGLPPLPTPSYPATSLQSSSLGFVPGLLIFGWGPSGPYIDGHLSSWVSFETSRAGG